jgi:hypothetical protein
MSTKSRFYNCRYNTSLVLPSSSSLLLIVLLRISRLSLVMITTYVILLSSILLLNHQVVAITAPTTTTATTTASSTKTCERLKSSLSYSQEDAPSDLSGVVRTLLFTTVGYLNRSLFLYKRVFLILISFLYLHFE